MPNDKFKAMVANFGGNQEEQVEPKRRKIASVKESENLSATALLDWFSDEEDDEDRKSTRLNSSHCQIS